MFPLGLASTSDLDGPTFLITCRTFKWGTQEARWGLESDYFVISTYWTFFIQNVELPTYVYRHLNFIFPVE